MKFPNEIASIVGNPQLGRGCAGAPRSGRICV